MSLFNTCIKLNNIHNYRDILNFQVVSLSISLIWISNNKTFLNIQPNITSQLSDIRNQNIPPCCDYKINKDIITLQLTTKLFFPLNIAQGLLDSFLLFAFDFLFWWIESVRTTSFPHSTILTSPTTPSWHRRLSPTKFSSSKITRKELEDLWLNTILDILLHPPQTLLATCTVGRLMTISSLALTLSKTWVGPYSSSGSSSCSAPPEINVIANIYLAVLSFTPTYKRWTIKNLTSQILVSL